MDVRRQANDNGMAEMPMHPVRREASAGNMSMGGGALGKILALLLIVASVAIIGWLGQKGFASMTADSAVKSKEYQAVFLTNGQVYFGKFSKVNSSYVELTDIFYLQVQQTVQPTTSSSSSDNNQQVSLAKLGGELHGPEDEMFISRSQVLFWENLKDTGKVVKAIKDYKAQGSK